MTTNQYQTIYSFFGNFLAERGVNYSQDSLSSYDIIKSGDLDSFELMTLIINIELEFGVKIQPESIVEKSTVNDFVTLISKMS